MLKPFEIPKPENPFASVRSSATKKRKPSDAPESSIFTVLNVFGVEKMCLEVQKTGMKQIINSFTKAAKEAEQTIADLRNISAAKDKYMAKDREKNQAVGGKTGPPGGQA